MNSHDMNERKKCIGLMGLFGIALYYIVRIITKPSRWLTSAGEYMSDGTIAKKRIWKIDKYILVCLVLNILFYCFSASGGERWWLHWVSLAFAIFRICDILGNVLRTLYDRLGVPRLGDPKIASQMRRVVLGLENYFELIICYGIVYNLFFDKLIMSPAVERDMFTALYFSGVTQLTIVYGDIQPSSFLRIVVLLQGISGLIIVVFVISRAVSLLKGEIAFDGSSSAGQNK